jgi:hypothetical protein
VHVFKLNFDSLHSKWDSHQSISCEASGREAQGVLWVGDRVGWGWQAGSSMSHSNAGYSTFLEGFILCVGCGGARPMLVLKYLDFLMLTIVVG